LMTICRRLTAPDPTLRYATAEQADSGSEGLGEFQRTLVRGDLASEYENELRLWLEGLEGSVFLEASGLLLHGGLGMFNSVFVVALTLASQIGGADPRYSGSTPGQPAATS